jgi:hypothetical protein
MTTTADNHYVQLYNDNVLLLAMQEDSRLKSAVRNESQEGEYEFFNQVGAIGYTTLSGSAGEATQLNTPTHYRRRVGLTAYSINPYLDKRDEVKMGWADPTSAYVRSAAATLNQIFDDTIVTALDGTAYTDKTGSTGTAYDTDNDIAVSGSLTVAHLAQAKKVLDTNEVASEGRYLALNAADLQTLLGDATATSVDYNSVKALVRGEIDTYLGFKFIRSERLGTTGGANKIFFWQQDGVLLSTGKGPSGMFTRIDERADLNYTKQLYTFVMCGATRMEEKRVGRILRTP